MITSFKIGPKYKREKQAKIKINQKFTKKDCTLKGHYNWYYIKLHKSYMQEILQEIDWNTIVFNSFIMPLEIEHKQNRAPE